MVDIRLPDGKVVFTIPEFDIFQAIKGDKFIYLVEYDLIHDVQNKGKTPLEVLTKMQKRANPTELELSFFNNKSSKNNC